MATVLVVDDRAANREVARITLDGGGHHVVEATGGGQALDLAGRIHPDVVLADVVMPGMDGYEFTRHLHDDPATARIPVVLYSANYRPDEAEPLAKAYGVTMVVPKSAEPHVLLDAIAHALESTVPQAPPALPPSPSTCAPSTPSWSRRSRPSTRSRRGSPPWPRSPPSASRSAPAAWTPPTSTRASRPSPACPLATCSAPAGGAACRTAAPARAPPAPPRTTARWISTAATAGSTSWSGGSPTPRTASSP